MNVKVVLSSDEIIRGLKHYKRIAKQDLLHAKDNDDSEYISQHAQARREIYSQLAEISSEKNPDEVVLIALEQYQKLPFVTGTPKDQYNDIKGKESALENFFSMINLEPKIRREARSKRTSLKKLQQK